MIYTWCSQCASRECQSEASHRVQRYISYRADFMLGGRYGKRIRKMFPTKKDAEAFEYITLADFKRGAYLPPDTTKILIKEFLGKYIETYVRRHMKGYKAEEYRLRAFESMFHNRPLNSLTLADWDRYVTARLADGLAKTTINRELTGIKVMLNWSIKNNFLKQNPWKDAVKFKEEVIKVRWLDDKEIGPILACATAQGDLDMRDILIFALNTGFRKANLKAVTAHDIINNRIEAKKTKSGKAYQVPINSELAKLIQRLQNLRPQGPLLNFENFRRRFAVVVKDSTVTLHTFRHTFAAQCLKRGIPIDRVCAWLGHHSVEFTRSHYGHLCPSQEAIEIELLNLGRTKEPRQHEMRELQNGDKANQVRIL